MRKLILALLTLGVGTFGFGAVANAQYGADEDDVSANPPVVVEEVAPAGGQVASGGSLPQTGSDGLGTTTGMALGLLAVGASLLGVTQVRRRSVAPVG